MAESGRKRDELTPVERHVERSFEDPESGAGRPLSRRTRQMQRSVEAYLRAGGLPRYMERLREIEIETRRHRTHLERSYRQLREELGEGSQEFARRWRARAASWSFDAVNGLIRDHNEWYPIEANLPMDPRTRDYVLIRGRSYRRRPLDADWVLEQFPPGGRGEAAA